VAGSVTAGSVLSLRAGGSLLGHPSVGRVRTATPHHHAPSHALETIGGRPAPEHRKGLSIVAAARSLLSQLFPSTGEPTMNFR